ncbi:hypothetical protein Airi01_023690 [Actinoallomurus iriomotensis]|uniref:Novel STAND NTPase 1 domain-containing protein n=1 Tax=Actinoallomurus iriomotensis TaxID=478107 RepID=A0A9W6RHD7_9ACTN|nr:hypothetical protein Airi01_023690 [Actinoallomurus iriomotensis]
MRAGVRARIARAARGAGGGFLRWSPATLLCVLCGGAFGPLVATALSVAGAGVAAAAIETAASVGGNLLADVISTGIDRLRGAEHSAGQEQIEAEVERLVGEILEAGGDRALELRSEIASVVRTVGATGAALEEAVASGDRELQALLTGAMTGLGEEFAEFRFLLDEVGEVLAAIQEELNEQGAVHRQMVDMLRTQNTDLRMMRETVAVIERRVRADDGAHPPDDPVRWPDGSPYRGLAPFEEDDGEIFYGRDLVTAELVGRLGERLAGTSLVIVNGPSGVGKSSLLRAGLLPALARGSLSPQSAAWPRVAITPARSPLLELGHPPGHHGRYGRRPSPASAWPDTPTRRICWPVRRCWRTRTAVGSRRRPPRGSGSSSWSTSSRRSSPLGWRSPNARRSSPRCGRWPARRTGRRSSRPRSC